MSLDARYILKEDYTNLYADQILECKDCGLWEIINPIKTDNQI